MRYWVHASADWEQDLPEEWQDDLKADVTETLRHLGGVGVTVALRKEDE